VPDEALTGRHDPDGPDGSSATYEHGDPRVVGDGQPSDIRLDPAQFGPPLTKPRIWWEIALVLLVSLGASAIYSIVDIINLSTLPKAISSQTATLNPQQDSRQIFDFIDQILGIAFDLAPVLLVCFLLWQTARPHLARLGLDLRRPGRDTLVGVGLALLIGIPGIGLYFFGRAIGITVNVVPSPLNDTYWWTIPVLILSAIRSGLQEEVIVIGYLFERLRRLGWNRWTIILGAAVLRGSYHLYQGIGAFFGNFVMGVLFGWLYTRYGRVLPLIIAHAIIDTAVFVGYPFAYAAWPGLFGGK
jgi:membrane protease YdiL (CAAX protease family)